MQIGSKVLFAEHNKSWWKKFLSYLIKSIDDNKGLNFYVDVYGDIEWDIYGPNMESGPGGRLRQESPGGADIDNLEINEVNIVPFKKDIPFKDIFRKILMSDMPDISIFMNSRDPMTLKLNRLLKRGLPVKVFLEGDDSDFNSVPHLYIKDYPAKLFVELKNGKLIFRGIKVNQGKLEKIIEDYIEKNEEPPEQEMNDEYDYMDD